LASFPGEPGLAGFIGAQDEGSWGDNCSCKTFKYQVSNVTTDKPTPNFLRARCPSCQL